MRITTFPLWEGCNFIFKQKGFQNITLYYINLK